MEDNRLVYSLCLAIAVFGIVIQFFSAVGEVDYLRPEMLGQEVIVRGRIDSKRVSNGHVFLEVNGLKAVVFEKDAKALSVPYFLLVGENVSLRGKVQEYEGELELIVSEVGVC